MTFLIRLSQTFRFPLCLLPAILLFATSSGIAYDTTSDNSSSSYQNSAQSQQYIAKSNPFYTGIQNLINDAKKPRETNDPDYIEPKYLNDLIKFAQRNWPQNYQIQYSFFSAELSYYKDTRQKSWYIYYEPPRGVGIHEYANIKKLAQEAAPNNWPQQRLKLNTMVATHLDHVLFYDSCLDILRNSGMSIVDVNRAGNFIVAKKPIKADTTVISLQKQDFFWTPTHMQIKINIVYDDLKMEATLLGYLERVTPKSEADKRKISYRMPITPEYNQFVEEFKIALIKKVAAEMMARRENYKEYGFWQN